MLHSLLAAVVAFILVFIVLALAGVPYAALIALAVAIVVFLSYGPVYGSRRRI